MLNIAVLVSGGGTNLQALLDAQEAGAIRNGRIVKVIASRPDAYALERAAAKQVPTAVVSRKAYATPEAFDEALLAELEACGAELVVQMVEQPQQFNAVFHYGDGELSCWQYDIVEMSCRDYPLEDGAMVRQYDTGTGPNRYSHLYTVFRYLPDGETEECASLAVHQDTQEDGTEVFTYLVDDAEVDQDTFAAEFEELVGSRLLSLEDWIPATERPG